MEVFFDEGHMDAANIKGIHLIGNILVLFINGRYGKHITSNIYINIYSSHPTCPEGR